EVELLCPLQDLRVERGIDAQRRVDRGEGLPVVELRIEPLVLLRPRRVSLAAKSSPPLSHPPPCFRREGLHPGAHRGERREDGLVGVAERDIDLALGELRERVGEERDDAQASIDIVVVRLARRVDEPADLLAYRRAPRRARTLSRRGLRRRDGGGE